MFPPLTIEVWTSLLGTGPPQRPIFSYLEREILSIFSKILSTLPGLHVLPPLGKTLRPGALPGQKRVTLTTSLFGVTLTTSLEVGGWSPPSLTIGVGWESEA